MMWGVYFYFRRISEALYDKKKIEEKIDKIDDGNTGNESYSCLPCIEIETDANNKHYKKHRPLLVGMRRSNRTLPMVEIGVRHKMIPIVVDAVAEHPPLPSIRKVP